MYHFHYTGVIGYQNDAYKGEISHFPMNIKRYSLISDRFYISNRQLVKYKSKEYLLMLDGIIYEFDHQPFSEDQYPLVADHLSNDIEKTLQRIDGEYTLFLVEHSVSPGMLHSITGCLNTTW